MRKIQIRQQLLMVTSLTLLAACTTDYPLGTTAQSNFTYPDSPVTPIRNVSGSASEMVFGGAVLLTGRMQDNAIDNALGGTPNANVLLNYNEDISITVIGPLFRTEYAVEGVAAQAEAK